MRTGRQRYSIYVIGEGKEDRYVGEKDHGNMGVEGVSASLDNTKL